MNVRSMNLSFARQLINYKSWLIFATNEFHLQFALNITDAKNKSRDTLLFCRNSYFKPIKRRRESRAKYNLSRQDNGIHL